MLAPRAGAAKGPQAPGHAAQRQSARGRGAVRGAEHGPGHAFSAILTPRLREAGSPLYQSSRAAAQAPSLLWCPECGVPFLESSGDPSGGRCAHRRAPGGESGGPPSDAGRPPEGRRAGRCAPRGVDKRTRNTRTEGFLRERGGEFAVLFPLPGGYRFLWGGGVRGRRPESLSERDRETREQRDEGGGTEARETPGRGLTTRPRPRGSARGDRTARPAAEERGSLASRWDAPANSPGAPRGPRNYLRGLPSPAPSPGGRRRFRTSGSEAKPTATASRAPHLSPGCASVGRARGAVRVSREGPASSARDRSQPIRRAC
ncbi:unnamed protein product [Rangifer tarandus platyrhynchus]|uniref:Uncharacterized protein n=2 Tax=Rangifer tarandus platyrhynchus TaxID=3082113 RepID=A0ACB0F3E4_RANTA|nr:unnamed protein product [Rangifer tarandus platyrhynchus]CAI9707612.1 unnamed protein product [Rangifer tarandus platyrhynchus]